MVVIIEPSFLEVSFHPSVCPSVRSPETCLYLQIRQFDICWIIACGMFYYFEVQRSMVNSQGLGAGATNTEPQSAP